MKKGLLFLFIIALVAICGFSGKNPSTKIKYLSYYIPPVFKPPYQVTNVQLEQFTVETQPLVLDLQQKVTV